MSSFQLITYIALGVALGGLVALTVLYVTLLKRQRALTERYVRLLEGTSAVGLGDILLEQIDRVKANSEGLEQLRSTQEALQTLVGHAFNRIGIVRYNPFDDMGGDFSVALALADSEGRGFVMSSLHGRSTTRLYVRNLINWSSTSQLSTEELAAVQMARTGKPSPEGNGTV